MNDNLKKLDEIKTILIDDLQAWLSTGNFSTIHVLSDAIYRISIAEQIEKGNIQEILERERKIKHLEEENLALSKNLNKSVGFQFIE